MKKRKLKKYVWPTVYIMAISVLFISISLLGGALEDNLNNDSMVVSAIKNDAVPVIKEEEIESISEITKPYVSSNVTLSKSYYDMNDEKEKQQNSLVYYENTYLQNSGVMYTSTETFDIISVYDGTVTNVASDEILGNFIEVTHNTNLKTIYYSLSEVSVKKDDILVSGDILGQSGKNKIEQSENCLLFEVYHNGSTIDPEEFYNMDINDLK